MSKYIVTYIAKDHTRRKRRVEADNPELARDKTIQELEGTQEPHVLRVVHVIEEV